MFAAPAPAGVTHARCGNFANNYRTKVHQSARLHVDDILAADARTLRPPVFCTSSSVSMFPSSRSAGTAARRPAPTALGPNASLETPVHHPSGHRQDDSPAEPIADAAKPRGGRTAPEALSPLTLLWRARRPARPMARHPPPRNPETSGGALYPRPVSSRAPQLRRGVGC